MRIRALLAIVACLALSVSAFAEKQHDDSEYQVTGDRVVITGSLTTSSPTYNRTLSTGTADPNCNATASLSGVGTAVYYETHCVTVTNSNPIEVAVDDVATTIGDTFMALYCDPFDPANSQANLVIADDDGGVGLYSAFTLSDNVTLTPGNNYWLVLTTYSNGNTGDYTINTSDNVVNCGPISVDASSWGMIKARY